MQNWKRNSANEGTRVTLRCQFKKEAIRAMSQFRILLLSVAFNIIQQWVCKTLIWIFSMLFFISRLKEKEKKTKQTCFSLHVHDSLCRVQMALFQQVKRVLDLKQWRFCVRDKDKVSWWLETEQTSYAVRNPNPKTLRQSLDLKCTSIWWKMSVWEPWPNTETV